MRKVFGGLTVKLLGISFFIPSVPIPPKAEVAPTDGATSLFGNEFLEPGRGAFVSLFIVFPVDFFPRTFSICAVEYLDFLVSRLETTKSGPVKMIGQTMRMRTPSLSSLSRCWRLASASRLSALQ